MPGGGDRLPEQRTSARTTSTHPGPQPVAGLPVTLATKGDRTSAGPTVLQAWAGPTLRAMLGTLNTSGLVHERITGGKTGTAVHSPTTRQTHLSALVSWEIVCGPIKRKKGGGGGGGVGAGTGGLPHAKYEYCITGKMGGQDNGSLR